MPGIRKNKKVQLVRANLKFACCEYKNLQFEKRKTIQRRMLKI